MPKKTKRQRKEIKRKEVKLSPDQQYKKALVLIENGHYASGVVFLVKALSSSPENQEIKHQLITAYDHLILSNVSSREFEKANTLLNKRFQLSKDQMNFWLVLEVFLENQRYEDALTHYTEFHLGIEKLHLKEKKVISKLIPYVFAEFDMLPKAFKATPLYKESKNAYHLFKESINEHFDDKKIKSINILGSYKDLRVILSGLYCLKTALDPQQYLEKIKRTSVFYDLARTIQAVIAKPYLTYNILQGISQAGLSLYRKIKGLDDREYKLLVKLLDAKRSLGIADYMFNILLHHSAMLGENGKNLLKGQLYQSGYAIKKYEKKFEKLTEIEKLKYNGLWHETSHNYCYDAERYFEKLIKLYAKRKNQKSKASLLSLHLAKHYAEDKNEALSYYKKAIKHNTQNVEAHEFLLEENINSNGISSDAAMKGIAQAAEKFPEYVKFQEHFIICTYERGIYDKAVSLATKLLTAYPVNKKARNILKKCSLSISLQLAKKGEFDKIIEYYNDISKYLDEKSQIIFKTLFLVNDILVKRLQFKSGDKKPSILNDNFGFLAFNIHGMLLGYTLDRQLKILAEAKHRLMESLSPLKFLIEVLPYFSGEINKKKSWRYFSPHSSSVKDSEW